MPTLTINDMAYPVPVGSLLSEVLPLHHVPELPCGGRSTCGKCRVTVTGALSQPSAAELTHLTPAELSAGVRLACCTRVFGNCSITPATEGLRQICSDGAVHAVSTTPLFNRYGAAVDIGTTTLVARLYGKSGQLSECTGGNPQVRFGADVISRVGYSLEGGSRALAECLREALANMLTQLARQASIAVGAIDTVVITGNTAMLYLLTESNPHTLSCAPFQADRLFGETLQAQALGLPCHDASVYLPPCISAFVGADMVTAIMSTALCSGNETRLLADVGTNGELALWHKGQLTCCSTAAGPAFEGAGLTMGMGGSVGAIDHIWLEGHRLRAHVLGEVAPTGICGSGVVDALACFLELGIMDEGGLLETDPAILSPPVYLTQHDIRMVQLAKSAIHAGLCTLMRQAELTHNVVHQLDIAGGFGSYLNVDNAGHIGLLPPALVPKVRTVGNAALGGAVMLLLDRTLLPQASELAATAHVVDLASNPIFSQLYADGMLFEHI